MASFAVWLEKRDREPLSEPAQKASGAIDSRNTSSTSDEHPSVELHFNFWYAYDRKMSREPENSILDIGIMINKFELVEKLHLYLPLAVPKDSIVDLGEVLQDGNTLNAVFNDNYRIKASSGGKAFLVTHKNDDEFVVYKLDPKKNVELRADPFNFHEKGTQATIDLTKLPDLKAEVEAASPCCSRCYFRIRITRSALSQVLVHARSHSSVDAFFHDVLSLTRILEVRLNHSRSLPSSLIEEVNSCDGFPCISGLHFFLLTDETVELLNDQRATIRRLEEHVWEKYLPAAENKKRSFDNVIAYHWKRKSDQDGFRDWDLYAKLNLLFRNKLTIALYVVVIVALSVIGGIITTLIMQVVLPAAVCQCNVG